MGNDYRACSYFFFQYKFKRTINNKSLPNAIMFSFIKKEETRNKKPKKETRNKNQKQEIEKLPNRPN